MKLLSFFRVFRIPALLFAIFVATGLTSGEAAAAPQSASGCQRLASIVGQSVASTLQSNGVYAGLHPVSKHQRSYACGTTAATASRAFSNALHGLGVAITWNHRPTIEPGDYCLSHYLDQCYPQRTGPGQVFAATNDADIATAWATVAANLRQVMPFGTQSDIVYFQSEQLAATLTLSLDVTLRTPRQAPRVGASDFAQRQ